MASPLLPAMCSCCPARAATGSTAGAPGGRRGGAGTGGGGWGGGGGREPQLAFEHAQPAPVAEAPIDAVHYPAGEIERQFALIFSSATRSQTSGRALIFSSDRQAAARNL